MKTHEDILTQKMADALEALGNPSRLAIFRTLVRAGKDGANMGILQREVGIPASTLTHHIQRLIRAGLVYQSRKSRELICRADFGRMEDLVTYLSAECCQGLPNDEKTETTP